MSLPDEGRLNELRSQLAQCEIEKVVLRAITKSATSDIRKDAFTEYTRALMDIVQLKRAIMEIENPQHGTSGASHA